MEESQIERNPYQPSEQDPGSLLDHPLTDTSASAAERIGRLFDRMASSRHILEGIISFCREPRAFEEVSDEVDRLKRDDFSVYGASSLVEHLQKAGALVQIGGEEEAAKVVEIDGVQYLEPAEPTPVTIQATEEGLAAVASAHTLGRFEAVLQEDARYGHIYRVLLDCCANEGGATAKQMGDAVDDDPELQDPRMYASYFFNRMSECDLIEWSGSSWKATDLGRLAAEKLDASV